MTDVSILDQNRAVLALFEEHAASEAGRSSTFLNYKKGRWIYGPNETEVSPNEEFAVNMQSSAIGYICWKDGKAIDEKMVTIVSGQKVNPAELADYGPYEGSDGWRPQRSVAMKRLEDGIEMKFSSSTKGGTDALKAFYAEYVAQIKTGAIDLLPIVSLSTDGYDHPNKAYGYINTPEITVLGWTNDADLQSGNVDLGSVDDTPPFELVEQTEATAPTRKRRRRTSEVLPQ